jgi:dTDP-4-amino-4,6-dideoxygalactose transaminase
MEEADVITRRRLDLWDTYHQSFAGVTEKTGIRRPVIPSGCDHNAHMYYLLLPSLAARTAFIERLKQKKIQYVPLDSSPMGEKHGRKSGELKQTEMMSDRLVRLPLWLGLEDYQRSIIDTVIMELEESGHH